MSDSRIEAIRKLADTGEPSAPEQETPIKVGPQRLTQIMLLDKVAIVSDGVNAVGAALTDEEVKKISKIGHKAYRRAMLAHLESVESASPKRGKRGRPKGTGKKRGRPKGTKNKTAVAVNGEAPRKRGRPPKNRTVTFEPQAAPQPEPEATS